MKPNTHRSVIPVALHRFGLALNSDARVAETSRLTRDASRLIKSFLLVALLCSGVAPLWGGIITSVTQLNGDTDRPEPKFSGQTFNVVNGSTTLLRDYTVPRFGENALAMTDRLHEWNSVGTNGLSSGSLPLPGYLVGAEYVLIANNNRDNANLTVTVGLASPAWIYLLIDNRIGDNDAATPPDFTTVMSWVVSEGWTPVTNGLNRTGATTLPDEVGWDENGDGSINQYGSVYRKLVTTGSVTLRQQGETRDMYGVVVAPAVIESVLTTNGDPVSERPEPKFTTQKFDLVNGSSGTIFANYVVPLFGEDAFAMTDRLHQWNGASASLPLPAYLTGNEYVAIANSYRDNASLQLAVNLRARSLAYLLVDNRIGDGNAAPPPDFSTVMAWVASDGWTSVATGRNRTADLSVPDEVGYDENGDGSLNQWGSVYARIVEPGALLLGPQNEGRDMYGLVVTPALAPAAPRLALLQLGETSAKLGWNAVEQGWIYAVKRSVTAGGPYLTVAGSVTGTSYVDTGLDAGRTYYYVVQASNLVGAGPDSSEVSATPQVAPTGLVAVGGTGQIDLGWNAMGGATAYIVKRAEVPAGPFSVLSTNIGINYKDSGLPDGTRYYYVVQAVFPGGGVSGDSASATAITDGPFRVWTTEVWDGTANPHAMDGVTLTGSGTDSDPFTYTIPKGMRLTSTGRINLHGAGDYNIQFVFPGGDLQMDEGAVLNTERYAIRSGLRTFTLDMGGTHSITGAGAIGGITSRDSTFRSLTIQNVRDVSLANIDMHVENANTGPAEFRQISIAASGAVLVSGTVDNSDRDTGGDGCGDITIKASSIDVNNVDARGCRNDPSGRAPYSGNVLLQALSPAGNYDPNDSVNNTPANRLTVRGAIRTMATDPRTLYGNVTLQGVVLQLVFGVIEVPPDATKALEVGQVRGGATPADLFINVSGTAETAANVIGWAGSFTPPAGGGPSFVTDPVVLPAATAGLAYAHTLLGTATDPESDPLSFAKLSGPAWLTVARDGALSGTPALTDSCTNTFLVAVTDGTRFDTATLTVFVAAGPRWNDGNDDFYYPDAAQDIPYSGSLAATTIYCGAQPLSYARLSGPAWLDVAPDGTLSGTPGRTNVLENVWTVVVSDGTFTNDATLRIWVNGSPKFASSPVIMANARVGLEYTSATLAGSAVDPQELPLSFTKVAYAGPGPDWLAIAPDGALSGVPAASNFGTNVWTIAADNGQFPATPNTLTIVVRSGVLTGPVEVVSREYWDGVDNPHAVDGVLLTGSGTEGDPATYTVPRGLTLSANGQIYTSKPTGQDSQQNGTVPQGLHIRFNIEGNLSLAGTNNAFVIALHARDVWIGQKSLILDLSGTNSIVGQGRIVGLGNRVDSLVFPDCFDRDTPRILTISNVVDVSLYDINVQTRNVNNWGRPLSILATGRIEVPGGIDNSDRDGGGDGGNDVTLTAKTIRVSGIRSDSARTSSFRNVGRITLRALAPPGFDIADGASNNSNNWITVSGNLRASTPQTNTTWGTITLEGVVLELAPGAAVNANAGYPDTPADKLIWNVGQIKNGATATDLFRNRSAGTYTANHVVNWSGTLPPATPASPQLLWGTAAPGQVVLHWSGTGFVLQQNANLADRNGWVNAPSGTANPATNAVGTGNLFYRLKWPQ
jgi:hypothetical protein